MNFCSGEMAPSKLLVSMACWASLSRSLRGFATFVDFDGADCGERETVADCAAAGSAAAIKEQHRQAGGGLVENVEDAAIVAAGEVRCKFQALGFPAGQRGGGLTETQIAETDLAQHSQLRNDFRDVGEKCERFANGHLQHVMNVFAV